MREGKGSMILRRSRHLQRERVHDCERPGPSENQAKEVEGPCQCVGQFSFNYHVITVGDGN